MKTLPITADLDVPGNVIPGLLSCRINRTMHTLHLHRSVERLGARIAETDLRATDCRIPNRSSLMAMIYYP
jgi:hypothetical protein